MQHHDPVDDRESQSDTGRILAARFVGLIEALKDMRDLVLGQSFTGIADMDMCLLCVGIYRKEQRTAAVDEFDRILRQVIEYLLDQVAVNLGKCPRTDIQSLDMQILFLDLLFKEQKRRR